jgi:hypothetical protein
LVALFHLRRNEYGVLLRRLIVLLQGLLRLLKTKQYPRQNEIDKRGYKPKEHSTAFALPRSIDRRTLKQPLLLNFLRVAVFNFCIEQDSFLILKTFRECSASLPRLGHLRVHFKAPLAVLLICSCALLRTFPLCSILVMQIQDARWTPMKFYLEQNRTLETFTSPIRPSLVILCDPAILLYSLLALVGLPLR